MLHSPSFYSTYETGQPTSAIGTTFFLEPQSPGIPLPQSQSYIGMSRTARLEARIKDLEASIRQAEAAASQSADVAKEWSNPILSGEQMIPRVRMDLQPFIVSYPAPAREGSVFTSFGFEFGGAPTPEDQTQLNGVSFSNVL